MTTGLPPGPPYPSPIQFLAFWTRPLASLERWRARYGKRFTMRLPFAGPFVILTDPEEVKQIYTAPPDVLHPGEGARVLMPVVGWNSVILLDEDKHMEQRKLILPAFHGERMERLTDLITRVTEDEIASWGGEANGGLHPRLQHLTMEIILRAVFGLDPGPRLDALRTHLTDFLAFGEKPITMMPPRDENMDVNDWSMRLLNRVGPIKGFLDLREETDRLIFEQIEERRAAGEEDRDDVLAMLLAARHEDGSPMSDLELRDELVTLLVAGHETTASSLAWAFERLSREPSALARLRDEVDAGESEEYTVATIHETLRHRPVLPNTGPRMVKKPIEVGGIRYEPGVSLVANAYLIHHDPDIYPEPYAFRPERFLGVKPGTYTWIPFGGGRRRCIGSSFAMLEMQIVIRELIRAYDLQPDGEAPETPTRRNITIRPSRGARVGLARREARVPVAA
jgi:cytochrome P450